MPGMPVTWQQLLGYYAAVVGSRPGEESPGRQRRGGQRWFAWRTRDEGDRFALYRGPDLLLGLAGPAPAEDRETPSNAPDNRWDSQVEWRRLGIWSGDRFYYGYPLVLASSSLSPSNDAHSVQPVQLYPLLFFPLAPTSHGWVVRTLRPRLNPLLQPADDSEKIPLLRTVGHLQRILEEGREPSPGTAVRVGRVVSNICQQLGLPLAEALTLLEWGTALERMLGLSNASEPGSPVNPASANPSPSEQVYNSAALFRLPPQLWLLPDWLTLAWQEMAEHRGESFPADLRQWVALRQTAAAESAVGESESPGGNESGRHLGGGEPSAVPTQVHLVQPPMGPQDQPELERGPQPPPTDRDVLLALDVLSPAERDILTRALTDDASLIQVPAGEGQSLVALHLILNAWYRQERVLVVAPSGEELDRLERQLEGITAMPFLGVWGDSVQTAHTWERLWRWLRRGMGGAGLTPAAPVGLAQAWQEVLRVEQGVQRAAQAGQRYLQARAQVLRPAAEVHLPPALARALHQAATGKAEAAEGLRLLPERDRLAGCLAEAERIQRGQWRWSERLWPWRRQQRALARLQGQVEQVLLQAGLSPGDWLNSRPALAAGAGSGASVGGGLDQAGSESSPVGWISRLRSWQATWEYGRRAGQLSVWQAQAGAGDWESPDSLVGKLRIAFEQVHEATREAIVGRRRQELAGLGEPERLQLIDFLTGEAELGQEVVPPVAESAQAMWHSLRQLESNRFPLVQKAIPIWGICTQDCERPLPDRADLFDRIVVIGAERIRLGVALPYLTRGKAVSLIAGVGLPGGWGDPVGSAHWDLAPGDCQETAETDWGGPSDEPESESHSETDRWLAARFGLVGEDYLHYRWSTSVYEWATRGIPPLNWLRLGQGVLPLAQLRQSLLLGGMGLAAGSPAAALPAVRWVPVDGREVCPRQGSAYNLEEAGAALSLLGEVLEHSQGSSTGAVVEGAEPQEATRPDCQVALVTPFWRQKEVLLRLLLERNPGGGPRPSVLVLLPWEMVGLTADWVILSPVVQTLSAGPAARYLRHHPAMVERVVKAARRGLWVVGSSTAVQALGGLWAELAQAVEESAQLRSTAADEVAVASEATSWCERGPYPLGSEGVTTLYRELLLARAGWKGRRELVGMAEVSAGLPRGDLGTIEL